MLPHSRPADTRPETTYGVRMRHNPEPESGTWATLVRANRDRLKLTQVRAAEMIGVSRETIIRWEGGRTLPDSIDVADRASHVLGIDQSLGRRSTGYAGADPPEEPQMWTYARSLGLDPRSETVQEILTAGWTESMTRRMLREERKLKEDDERRRLERIRLAKEMYRRSGEDDGLDQAAR